MFFHTAECRLRWHTVFEHAHLPEPTKIDSAEIYYVHTPDTPPMSGRILSESAYRGANGGHSPYSTFKNRG